MSGAIENKNPAGNGYISRDASVPKTTGETTVESGVIGARNDALPEIDKGQKKGGPEAKAVPDLPPINEKKVDWSKFDGVNIIALLGLEQNKNSLKAAESDAKMNLDQQKKTAEERIKVLEESQKKAAEAKAKEGGFWRKFLSVVGKAASLLGSIASIAMGAMLIASGVGAVAGGFMIALAVSSLANMVMESLIETGVIDDPGWRPTISSGVKHALTAMGVDENTAAWIGLGIEIAANLAVMGAAFSNVYSVAKEINQIGTELAKAMGKQFTAIMTGGVAGKVAQAGGAVLGAAASIGTGVIMMDVGKLESEATAAQARAEELRASMTRLSKQMQMDVETIEMMMDRVRANTELVSEIVQGTAEATRAIASNMGGATV